VPTVGAAAGSIVGRETAEPHIGAAQKIPQRKLPPRASASPRKTTIMTRT